MMKIRYIAAIVPVFGAMACNEAKFQGGAANRISPEQEVSFTCEATPTSTEVGQKVAISVQASIPYDLPVYQSIKNGDQQTEAVLKFAEGGYKKDDQSPNELNPEREGRYVVELRSIQGGPVKGQCEFNATGSASDDAPPTETEAPKCEEDQVLVGANVAFIIDNSFSHATTDCSGFDQRIWRNERRAVCNEATNREKAVLAAFDSLAEMSGSSNNQDRSKSHLAIASFPTKEDVVGGGAIRTSEGWIESTADGRANLESAMKFSREPLGYTPYGGGLVQAQSLFGNGFDSHGDKPKVAVLVTDGEPTDQNPRQTVAIADELRSMGVKLITVYVLDGKSRAERRSEHAAFLADENRTWQRTRGRTWFDNDEFNAFDDYLAALMGKAPNQPDLVTQISSKVDASCEDSSEATCTRHIVEVNNSADLMATFKGLVREATVCE